MVAAYLRDLYKRYHVAVLMGALLLPASPGLALDTIENGIDRSDGSYYRQELRVASPFRCRQLCQADPSCLAWTMSRPRTKSEKALCFLSRDITTGRRDDCCTSGTIDRVRIERAGGAPAPGGMVPGRRVAQADKDLTDWCVRKIDEIMVLKAKADQQNCTIDAIRNANFSTLFNACREKGRWALEDMIAQQHVALRRCQPTARNTPAPTPGPAAAQKEKQRPALSESPDLCRDYIRRAIDIAQRARACPTFNPKDARWSLDPEVHSRECRAYKVPGLLEKVLEEREHQVQTCRFSPPVRELDTAAGASQPSQEQAACKRFARQAVTIAAAGRRKCGYRGTRWSTRVATQRARCLRMSQARRDRELATMRARVRQCQTAANRKQRNAQPRGRAGGPESETCKRYAWDAVSITRKARAMGCGYRSPPGTARWSVKKRRHRYWCAGKSLAALKREHAIRLRKFRQCERRMRWRER